MTREISIKQLAETMDMPYELIGSATRMVVRAAPLDTAKARSVSFYSKQLDGASGRINNSKASVVIGPKGIDLEMLNTSMKTCILCRNPRLAFIRIVKRFFTTPRPTGIDASAIIHEEAIIGPNVHIGPFTCIGRAAIGDGTVIEGHVSVCDKVSIGMDCTIQSGSVIGSPGFGMERNEIGELEDFPHIGGVIIGDRVVLGNGVMIARGTINDTVIGTGTRIDSLCQISHNVWIGNHCVICALSTISGSTQLGDYTWVAGGVSIREKVRIGSGAMIGLGSVVVEDVKKGSTVYGVPAKERKIPNSGRSGQSSPVLSTGVLRREQRDCKVSL